MSISEITHFKENTNLKTLVFLIDIKILVHPFASMSRESIGDTYIVSSSSAVTSELCSSVWKRDIVLIVILLFTSPFRNFAFKINTTHICTCLLYVCKYSYIQQYNYRLCQYDCDVFLCRPYANFIELLTWFHCGTHVLRGLYRSYRIEM